MSDFLKHKGNSFGPKRSIPNLQTTRKTRNSAKQENPNSNAFEPESDFFVFWAFGRISIESSGTNCKCWTTFFIAFWKVHKNLIPILESHGSRYQLEPQSVTGFLQNSCSAESVYLQPRVLNQKSGFTTIFWWVWRTRNREEFWIQSISASVELPPMY